MTIQHVNDKAFCQLIGLVLNSEGGYVDHPNDPGGPTNHGIAYNYNVAILRDKFGINTPHEIRKLTVEQAKEIYYIKYWLTIGADKLNDTALAYVAFDCSVNQGPGRAKKWLPVEAFKFNGNGQNINLFRKLRTNYIRARNKAYTVTRNWDKFGWGWMNRMCDVATYAERVAAKYPSGGMLLLGKFGTVSLPKDETPEHPVEFAAYGEEDEAA